MEQWSFATITRRTSRACPSRRTIDTDNLVKRSGFNPQTWNLFSRRLNCSSRLIDQKKRSSSEERFSLKTLTPIPRPRKNQGRQCQGERGQEVSFAIQRAFQAGFFHQISI